MLFILHIKCAIFDIRLLVAFLFTGEYLINYKTAVENSKIVWKKDFCFNEGLGNVVNLDFSIVSDSVF